MSAVVLLRSSGGWCCTGQCACVLARHSHSCLPHTRAVACSVDASRAHTHLRRVRRYFASSKEQVLSEAQATISELASEAETLRKQKAAVEQKYLEAQNELKELVQGLRALKAA